jgi:hypothetical protein
MPQLCHVVGGPDKLTMPNPLVSTLGSVFHARTFHSMVEVVHFVTAPQSVPLLWLRRLCERTQRLVLAEFP